MSKSNRPLPPSSGWTEKELADFRRTVDQYDKEYQENRRRRRREKKQELDRNRVALNAVKAILERSKLKCSRIPGGFKVKPNDWFNLRFIPSNESIKVDTEATAGSGLWSAPRRIPLIEFKLTDVDLERRLLALINNCVNAKKIILGEETVLNV